MKILDNAINLKQIFMASIKTLLFNLILIFFCSTGHFAVAQESTTSSNANGVTTLLQQSENTDVKEKKKKKDKDGVKDNIQIDINFFINLLIDILSVVIIVVLVYYPNYHKRDMFFTYFLFNISIFLLTFLLNEVKMSMGAAFGLFAVFSMLRYRTEGISMKDMTYLFIVIAIGLVGAIRLEYYELAVINGLLIIATFILDGNLFIKREFSKRIQYEKIEMIKPENHLALIDDLKVRTGLNIHRISITKIDFRRDIAVIDIYFYNNIKVEDKKNSVPVNYNDNSIE